MINKSYSLKIRIKYAILCIMSIEASKSALENPELISYGIYLAIIALTMIGGNAVARAGAKPEDMKRAKLLWTWGPGLAAATVIAISNL